MEFHGNLEIVAGHYFSKVFFSTSFVAGFVSQFRELSVVLFEEKSCIEAYKRLFPHLHDEVMAVECILALLRTIRGQHC
jgi:hypothetical protein